MKFRIILYTFAVAAVFSACTPTESKPTAAAPADTQIPDAADAPLTDNSISPLDFLEDYFGKGTYCADSIQKAYALIDQLEEDFSIIDDENWIEDKNKINKTIGDTCLQLGRPEGAPAGYEASNALFLETRPYFDAFIVLFWEGIQERDIQKVTLAQEKLKEASGIFSQAGKALPE